MERMTPPPNYFGAPYPSSVNGSSMPSPNYPGPNMNQQPMFTNEKFNQNNAMPVAGEGSNTVQDQDVSSYDTLVQEIDNVKTFYDAFKKHINKNIGKKVKIYCSFPDSTKWHDVVFEGTLVSAGNDNMMIKSDEGNFYNLISAVYINFVEFFEN